jgi:simple sugar transport system permease protein
MSDTMVAADTVSIRRRVRPSVATIWYLGIPVWAIAIAFLLGAGFILMLGKSPWQAYSALFNGAIGTHYGIGLTFVRAAPLVLAGLAVAVPRRAGLFNIGAEGQLQLGGLAAAYAALHHAHPVVSLALAAIAGALFAALPGYLRAWHGVNEAISTIMLNFVAIAIVLLLVQGPLQPKGATYPTTGTLPRHSTLPNLVGGNPVHAGVILAFAATLVAWWFLFRTTIGFRLRAVGHNPQAATHAGVHVPRTMLTSMIVGGLFAGLAGAGEVLGVQYQLGQDWSTGWGYSGIVVAFLAGSHPFGVALVALFYGMLNAGATSMQFATGVPGALVSVIQGLPVLFLVWFVAKGKRPRLTLRGRSA